jgi:hypothetical protein
LCLGVCLHLFYLRLVNHHLIYCLCFILCLGSSKSLKAQEANNTQQKVNQLVEKKAEYHRLTDGEQEGYRIKIHFGPDRDKAKAVRTKFSTAFTEYLPYEDYQQPNFVVLVGDFKTKLEAYEALKKIQIEFPSSFIVKGRIKVK